MIRKRVTTQPQEQATKQTLKQEVKPTQEQEVKPTQKQEAQQKPLQELLTTARRFMMLRRSQQHLTRQQTQRHIIR